MDETAAQIGIGTVVRLKSGGGKMTVRIVHPNGTIAVSWMDDTRMQYDCLPVAMVAVVAD